MALLHVGGTKDGTQVADIIFVHGLDGHPVKTWSYSGDERQFWPKWISEERPDLCIWSLGYNAASSGWLGTSLPLFDRVENALFLLQDQEIGVKPVFFIVHSLGGLLVKQMLRLGATRTQEYGQRLVENTRGILFFATPHTGSAIASIANWIRAAYRPTVTMGELQQHSPYLREVNDWFKEHFERLRLHAEVYKETEPYLGQIIVDAASSDPGITGIHVIPIEANHVSICKFQSKDDPLYRRVCKSLLKYLPRTDESSQDATVPRSPSPESCRVYLGASFAAIKDASNRFQSRALSADWDFEQILFFGSQPVDAISECTEKVRSAHVCAFVVNTTLSKPGVKAIFNSEIEEAANFGIPCLFYFDERNAHRTEEFNEELIDLRSPLCARRKVHFSRIKDLSYSLFHDIANLVVHMGQEPIGENTPQLIKRHVSVLSLLNQKDYHQAETENKTIIADYPFLPRAYYNQACILCRQAPTSRFPDISLRTARNYLARAFRYKIMHVISESKGAFDPRTAIERIENDPDLQLLFTTDPDVLTIIRNGRYSSLELHYGGCVCGCEP